MEKQIKVVVSKKEPQNKHVLWLEQDPLHEVSPKLYNNGEWQNLKTVNVPEELLNKVGELNDSVKEFDKEVENFSSDITSFRNSLITETQQRMAVDSSLGNRITSVTVTANNNTTSLNTLETKLNTNLVNLKAKDTELETAINNEAKTRRNEVDSLQTSISNVGKRVSTTESKIITLQGNVSTLQSEVTNVKNDVVPKAVAEGIAQVVANAPEDLDTLKEVAEYIASDKTNADKIITDISNLKTKDSTHDTEIATLKQKNTQLTNSINVNATNIAKNTSDITANTEVLAKQAKELANKAPKVGYAPDLKVDFAKELVGRGVAEPQEIGVIRPTGVISIGDGNATIEKVRGKSVVWNQLLKCEFTEGETYYGSVKPTVQDGKGFLTFTATGDSFTTSFIATKNHYYLWKANLSASTGCRLFMHSYGVLTTMSASTDMKVVQGIVKYTSDSVRISVMLLPLQNITESTDIVIDYYRLYDLTQMFGEGNEPTTLEEFEARKPLGVTEAYNEGEIISYDGANELKSVGFNAFNGTYAKVIGGQQYHALGNITSIGFTTELGGETTAITLDSEGMFTPTENGYVYAVGTDICIHLTHTYTPEHTTEYEEDILTLPDVKAIKDKDGNQLFPYGLLSAGSAYDEITATKAVKRIGVVDMGSLIWGWSARENHILISAVPNMSKSTKRLDGLLSNRYVLDTHDAVSPNMTNMSFKRLNGNIYVRNNSYTNVTDFKQAMQGVLLYYELAEPIEVDLPEPLNLTYDAWDFGTEELIAEGKTTPLNADIVYQFNAVDRIRENTAKNQALEAELAELKAQLTQLTKETNEQNSNTQ